MTWNGLMAHFRYFTEFGSFQGPLHKSGWRYVHRHFCDRNVAQRI